MSRNESGQLDIDGILGTSLSIWPRLMLAFGPIYALEVLPPVLAQLLGQQPGQPHIGALGAMLAAQLVGFVITIVFLGALTRLATEILDGGQLRIMAALSIGIRRFWPVLGACTLAGLAMVLGFILLVVPGFIVATWYFLVVPICVLEELGPAASLKRSSALSRGVRWRIFGLVVIVAVAGGVSAACTHFAQEEIGGFWAIAVSVLVATAIGIFGGTVPVVAYRARVAGSRAGGFGAIQADRLWDHDDI